MSKFKVIIKKINTEYIDNNYDRLVSGLYEQRKKAVEKLKYKKAAYTSIMAGYLLIEAFKDVYGEDNADITIEKGEFGKPYVEDYPEFKYNISHSCDYVAIVYGKEDVGIDVEQVREKDLKIAKRCFHEDEFAYIIKDEYGQDERFFEIWTMKEAYLKYTGQGINIPLNSFVAEPDKSQIRNLNVNMEIKKIDNAVVSVCSRDISDIEYKIHI